MAALSALASELVLEQPLPVLLDRALALITPLLSVQGGIVRLLDEERQELVLAAQRGLSGKHQRSQARMPVVNGPLAKVITENQPRLITEGLREEPDYGSRFPFDAILSVPLRVGSNVLGSLSLLSTQPREFDEQEIAFVQAMANQVAIAVQNSRLLEERERQIAELRAIGSISHAAGTALDLPALLRQVHDALRAFLKLDAFAMVVYDPQRQLITDGISIDEGRQYGYWSNQPPPRGSLTEWVVRNRAPLHFNNLPEEIASLPELDPHVVGVSKVPGSWLGVPLFNREGEPIGLIAIQSYIPYAFTVRDKLFLQNVAQQVALHVQNVHLLTQRERQIRELNVIGRISQAVTSTLDLQAVLERLHHGLGEVLDVRTSFIGLYDPDLKQLSFPLCFDQGSAVTFEPMPISDLGITGWVIQNRQSLLVGSAEEADAFDSGIIGQRVGREDQIEQSYLVVPIIASAQVLGVINLQSYEHNAFSQQDLAFVSTVAGHAAAAIRNARLFAESQDHAAAAARQAHKMELVHRISTIFNSRLNEQEILDLAALELVRLFWADHIGIVMFDEDAQMGTLVSEYPDSGARGVRFSLSPGENPIVDELLRTRRPVILTPGETDPRTRGVDRATVERLRITSLMIVPLVVHDKVIGSIGLDSIGDPRTFTDEEQDLFMAIATSIGAAIENARLFEAEQAARQTADTLREIARVLSTSFDPEEVLQLILRELQKVIPYDTASILMLSHDLLRVAAYRGWTEEQVATRPMSVPSNTYPSFTKILQARRPLIVPDTLLDPDWVHVKSLVEIRSWIGAPLISKGEVLGIVNIEATEPNRFSERDQEALLAFANHAAIALENARLYQQSVTRVEQEISIARQIQSNLFPRALPQMPGLAIAASCIPARETGGDFYDFVSLGDHRLALMVGDASGKSIPAAMLMAIARSIARSEARDHETPQAVMRETNRWIAFDVPHQTFVALCYATIDLRRRQLALSNAGQLTPLLRRATGELEYLEVPGPRLPLGILPTMHYSALTVQLEPGDLLLFYTDGIVEARNRKGEIFGFDRLETLLCDHGGLPPAQMIDDVMWAISDFVGRTPQHDDMTLVAIRIE